MLATRRRVRALVAATLSCGALAQASPAEPIPIVVPCPPGGGTGNMRVAAANNALAVLNG